MNAILLWISFGFFPVLYVLISDYKNRRFLTIEDILLSLVVVLFGPITFLFLIQEIFYDLYTQGVFQKFRKILDYKIVVKK